MAPSWLPGLLAVALHLLLFYSIFDIYFTSELVRSSSLQPLRTPQSPCPTPTGVDQPAAARRLVLIVSDGIRADKVFGNLDAMPFIRGIVQTTGAWGLSHTRVPTESRPGHVAIIAGFYEDVASITKGWQDNAVEFDHVFNQSRRTWAWGSPDIVDMFARSALHVRAHSYPIQHEEFGKGNTQQLDAWVFDRAEEFLLSRAANTTVSSRELQSDQIVLFLHLLGMDTCGHSLKPHSKDCLLNQMFVDSGVARIADLVSRVFPDNLTAFLFTSDHGMTDWGSHGSGNTEETETPFVAWGAGVRGPRRRRPAESPASVAATAGQSEKYSGGVGTAGLDVDQADLCPLMAALINVSMPVNNVGLLPVSLLTGPPDRLAWHLEQNVRQLAAGFLAKRHEALDTRILPRFVEFPDLPGPEAPEAALAEARDAVGAGEFDLAMQRLNRLGRLCVEGLRYFHKYDRAYLGFYIVLSFVLWITFVVIRIAKACMPGVAQRSPASHPAFKIGCALSVAMAVLHCCLLYVGSRPPLHYLYCLTPHCLAVAVLSEVNFLLSCWRLRQAAGGGAGASTGPLIWDVVFLSIGVVLCALGFSARGHLSAGVAWLGANYARHLLPLPPQLRVHWPDVVRFFASGLLLCLFPLLPVVGGLLHPGLLLLHSIGSVAFSYACLRATSDAKIVMPLSIGMSALTGLMSVSTHTVFHNRDKPLPLQATSWCLLAATFPLIGWANSRRHQLDASQSARDSDGLAASVALLFPLYGLMCISYEGVFMLTLSVFLGAWTRIERLIHLVSESSGLRCQQDVADSKLGKERLAAELGLRRLRTGLRQNFCFVFLLLLSFFGTGNIASINTFDTSSVYCFITVFRPFIMGFLLLVKILLPMLIVGMAFAIMERSIHVLEVMLFSDVLALQFFFQIRDEGSWLDIGTSISHYVVVMGTTVASVALLCLSRLLLRERVRS